MFLHFILYQGSRLHWKWEETGENVILLTYPLMAYSRVLTYMFLYISLFPKFRVVLRKMFFCKNIMRSKSIELMSVTGVTEMNTETSVT